jgi:hypothetical protein
MKDQESSCSSSSSWLDDLERIVASSTPQRQLAQLRIRYAGSLAEQFVQHQPPQQELQQQDHRWMAILDRIISCDPTLTEEIVCHPSFRTPTFSSERDRVEDEGNGHDDDDDEDDEISHREELVYRILAFQKQFPTQQCCSFTNEELYQRLPISLPFGVAGGDDNDENNDISVLLHQVTQRQSAQSDVGFGTYIILLLVKSIIIYSSKTQIIILIGTTTINC